MNDTVLNIGDSAISYLCNRVSQDECHDSASKCECLLNDKFVSLVSQLQPTPKQDQILENDFFCLLGEHFNLGYKQGFAEAFKLGIRAGIECFINSKECL